MTITTNDHSYNLTAAQLRELAVRFEIRSFLGCRTFYVDGRKVSEQEYATAIERAAAKPSLLELR